MGWWTRGSTIGRGSSATVSLATAASGELLAVKSNELSCSSLLQKEQNLISQLSSPYIVEYIGSDITCESGKLLYNLLIEYVPGGTISDLIKKQGGSLRESTIQFYAHQILKGLEFLHLNGIVHCDIKGRNILIGEKGAKIADFGCARIVENQDSENHVISGTPIFMAPEVARGEEQGFAADIWAFGCTIIEMATGASPWPEMNDPVSALYRIGYSGEVPEFPKCLSSNAKEFLKKCLNRDAKERWTAKQLLEHPFFAGIGTNSLEDSNSKVVRNSPTGILDQSFWDSMEVSEFAQESSEIISSFSSPANRIKSLIGDDASGLPNWTEDEDWVTVRGIVQEEIVEDLEEDDNVEKQDDGRSSSMESLSFSVACVEGEEEELELETSIAMEDLLLYSLIYDEIDHIIMYFEIVKDVIALINLDSEIKITEVLQIILLKFHFTFFSLILEDLQIWSLNYLPIVKMVLKFFLLFHL